MDTAIAPSLLDRRHPADYRCEIEYAGVARILSALPPRHPARIAYATGARETSDSNSLFWLIAGRRNIVLALVHAN